MAHAKHRVAVIGCGSMGQQYARAYAAYPDTELVAISEYNPDRLRALGETFGVKALYSDVHALLRDMVPDIAAVVTPTKFFKEAVIACAEAGVKGVSTDKPIAAQLSDADEMVAACEERGVVYAGGNLMRARHDLQHVARQIHSGEFGPLIGGCVINWGASEISGGGCQQVSVLRLLMDAEVEEVAAWGEPEELLASERDEGQKFHGQFRMTNGLTCPLFFMDQPSSGVDVWSQDALIRTLSGKPELFRGFDESGARIPFDQEYEPFEWSEFGYLTGSIRSFLAAVETGSRPWITGHDLRQALEVAIAAKLSAQRGMAPVQLPLADRSHTLYPTAYRWAGGDVTGRRADELLFGD